LKVIIYFNLSKVLVLAFPKLEKESTVPIPEDNAPYPKE